ncbi:class I SAM-dependent methyltransferase [Colwellia sp. C1TZA3]|uniref:class I SAM-dependent methyltransferase n=1 Tax=Colwellia sp. C1TZA3 TaxID=2508879 RepID=UPI0011BA3F2E|nr:class I SAM-dependent methyltransferase [Colwellia sp. C1TZA3]TWX73270.1 class I SAM-dependent methyltransferase [Colwellia sp. C1TZA3]
MQHWNSYWSGTKSLNSFAEGEHSQGYVGKIASFWQNIFNTLPQLATILDLASGNGGLAVLAKQFNSGFDVFASDAANIDPLLLYFPSDPSYQHLKSINFYGNTLSENLVFDSGKFDYVISQFGFEYAESAAALLEVNRVLKSGGEFIALIHHQDSFISADCRLGLKVINNLNQVDGLLTQLQDFGRFCQTMENKNHLSPKQQIQFKQKNVNLLQLFKEEQSKCSSEDELDWYNLLVKELLPAIINWQNTDEKKVIKIIENLHSFQRRLQDQNMASQSKLDIEGIKLLTNNNWSSCKFDVVNLRNGVLCWVMRAQK